MTRSRCESCAHVRTMDGVKLCGLVYGAPSINHDAAKWLNDNMNRDAGRLKTKATGCPVYAAGTTISQQQGAADRMRAGIMDVLTADGRWMLTEKLAGVLSARRISGSAATMQTCLGILVKQGKIEREAVPGMSGKYGHPLYSYRVVR